MTTSSSDQNCAEAVRAFARDLWLKGAPAPDRVLARLDRRDGMSGLAAVEAAIGKAWPKATAKELVWLTRAPGAVGEVLRLVAYGADGAVLGEAAVEIGCEMAVAA